MHHLFFRKEIKKNCAVFPTSPQCPTFDVCFRKKFSDVLKRAGLPIPPNKLLLVKAPVERHTYFILSLTTSYFMIKKSALKLQNVEHEDWLGGGEGIA